MLSVLAVLAAPSYLQQGLTAQDAEEVYNNLKGHTGAPEMLPPLVISDSDVINAYASNGSITITMGMLKFLKSKDELAFVIGHEMGHVLLSHLSGQMSDDSRIHEANADKFGTFLVLRAGYDVCVGKSVWQRFVDVFGDSVITASHPSSLQRAWELDFPMCTK